MACSMRIENFLFCFSLRSGIFFLASSAIIFHICLLMGMAVQVEIWALYPSRTFHVPHLKEVLIFSTVLACLVVLSNILLIIGMLIRSGALLVTWLVFCGIYILILVAMLLACNIIFGLGYDAPYLTSVIFFFFFFIVCWVLYSFGVVYSYYKMMDMETQSIHPTHDSYNHGYGHKRGSDFAP
ncbi:uncharacterized protein LOC143021353 [Oratosquilla oratoria]|uniref:uncharacterized protein LOC143021353 n=1 Tax=Oratosquilla oratoria TaxID=337810 RepID=UPI003F76FAB3